MTVERFGGVPGMEVFREAQKVYVLTLVVPQKKTRERWLDRKAREDSRQVATNLVRILSETDGKLYGHLYRIWYEFLATIGPKKHWRIREEDSGYVIEELGSDVESVQVTLP